MARSIRGRSRRAPTVFDDGSVADSIIAGRIAIGEASPVPTAGGGYVIVAECTIQFTAEYGGGTTSKDFARRVRIVASYETAPAS